MLNALEAYEFDEHAVRVVLVQGDPWFVATDVATVLGYRNGPDMARNLHEDEKGTHIVRTLGGEQALTIISESGLYAAIFKSRREEAQRFRRWVTGEVLPAIRKTGRYVLHEPPEPQTPALVGDGETARLTAAVAAVREARQIFGPVQTRSIWAQFGLPLPIAEAKGADGDPLINDVAAVLSSVEEATIEDVMSALGMSTHPVDMGQRRRIGAAMRLLGWEHETKYRQGRGATKVWRCVRRPMPAEPAEA